MEPADNTDEPTERDAQHGRDRGATFIELLVSVVLLGTAGVAVLTALAAAAHGAGVHRDVSDAQAWLATTGDALAEVPPGTDNYVACATPSDYQPIVDSVRVAGAPAVVVTNVAFWDSSTPGGEGFGATCRYTSGDRLQQITLVTTIDGVARTLVVVKRPALEQTVNTQPPPTTLGGGNYAPIPTPGLDGP